MTDRIGLVGTGLLRDAIAATLGAQAMTVSPENPYRVAMLVVATDAWDTSSHAAVRRRAVSNGTPWLPVWTELGHAVIGPLEIPQEAGCVDCAATRRRRILAEHAERAAVRQRYADHLAHRPSSWLTGLAAQLVAAVIAEEIDRVTSGGTPRTRLALHRVELSRLSVTRHAFLPDPTCPVCGRLPDDAAERAELALVSRPTHAPGRYRTRSISEELPRLVATYVDEESGLVRSLNGWSDGSLVLTSAPVGWRTGPETATGYGAAATFQESRVTALLEALERYASSPGGRRTAVTAAYRELADHAVDPRALGLYPPERYELPGFRYRPFSPEKRYRWVWGWSFARGEPILVPEACAYYGLGHRGEDDHGFVNEISNGCAIGSCLEEAILHGVLEVAERDAFLLAWYARLPAPRMDLASVDRRAVALLAASISAETGYQVRCFDISTEQRIPCIWAMAVNPSDDGRPAGLCAAGSHPDSAAAIHRALAELGPSLSRLIRRYEDRATAERAHQMAADPTLVREMEDHSLLYADPLAATRLDFLTGSGTSRAVAGNGRSDAGGFASDDLRDNLLEAVSRFTRHGMDVIVVDQTTPEHRAGGFACVKVLIPGTLPMTFGHRYRRVDGLPRLYEIPRLLGYRDRPLRPGEVNPHPHPFP